MQWYPFIRFLVYWMVCGTSARPTSDTDHVMYSTTQQCAAWQFQLRRPKLMEILWILLDKADNSSIRWYTCIGSLVLGCFGPSAALAPGHINGCCATSANILGYTSRLDQSIIIIKLTSNSMPCCDFDRGPWSKQKMFGDPITLSCFCVICYCQINGVRHYHQPNQRLQHSVQPKGVGMQSWRQALVTGLWAGLLVSHCSMEYDDGSRHDHVSIAELSLTN